MDEKDEQWMVKLPTIELVEDLFSCFFNNPSLLRPQGGQSFCSRSIGATTDPPSDLPFRYATIPPENKAFSIRPY